MIRKILGAFMLGVPALLMTILSGAWWHSFGTQEVFPYLGTFMACVLWGCVYLTIKEKEE